MKAIFGVNQTDSKGNLSGDEEIFIKAEIDQFQKEKLDRCMRIAAEQTKRADFPLWLKIVQLILLFTWIIVIGGIVKALIGETSLSTAYHNAPYLFYLAPIAFIGWLFLYFYSKRRKASTENSDDYKNAEDYCNQVLAESEEQLHIPSDAERIDILSFFYKKDNEELKPINKGFTTFVNFEKQVYADETMLYLADATTVIGLPKEEMKRIVRINKKTFLPAWNKMESLQSSKYLLYHMKTNSYGMIFIQYYFRLELEHAGEIYVLYFPPYELSIVEQLTGLECADEEK
ncbi:MAG: hypothetical protein LKE36_06810 [Bacilli bacterium]|jgi:hypothetical protein|nr:hypothetical protein [Bacilli bacterium]